VADVGKRAAGAAFLKEMSSLFSQKELLPKVVESENASKVILDEAYKDYDLLVFGASEDNQSSNVVFTPLVDYLVRMAPCPTIVVQGERVQPDWDPKRILVPTNGSRAARNAAELAFALATDEDDEVQIMHVVVDHTNRYFLDADGTMFEKQLAVGQEMVRELCELGKSYDVPITTDIQVGTDVETMILNRAREHSIDLIVLGTDVRPGSERLFLGPRVERILKNAPCPVIVFNS
jgi:nucleotide-binding universal stress UspA family protein